MLPLETLSLWLVETKVCGLQKRAFIMGVLLGFYIGGSGNQSIRFRPALIFQPSHANMFLEAFEKVLNEKSLQS